MNFDKISAADQEARLRAIFTAQFLSQFQKVVLGGVEKKDEKEFEAKVVRMVEQMVSVVPDKIHASIPMLAAVNVLIHIIENTDGFTILRISNN